VKRQRAQALVEFAVISTLFFLLFFVILDGGRLIYTYATVGEAAREGAHAAEIQESTDANIRSAINAHTGLLGDLGTGATITPSGSRTANQTVTVSVSYTFRTITPLLSSFGLITFTASTVVVAE
jgi:Flp pilus assembly protein TadG